MTAEIKAIDVLINVPGAPGLAAEHAVESEKAAGKGGALELFPDLATRQRDMTPEELISEMDEAGVEKGVLCMQFDADKDWIIDAIEKYPGRFIPAVPINPIERGIMNEIRRVKSLIHECGLQIIRVRGWHLGVPCTDKRLSPFYALAIEYNLKVYINIGYPGPAGLAWTQRPLYVDELCYLFPELEVMQTHTGHPWIEEAIHNVIKYPNCYLATTSYRPKYFPTELLQHINTRAQDKVLWGTEYPMLTFKRSLDDIQELPLRDHVRPKYLRENALRILNFG